MTPGGQEHLLFDAGALRPGLAKAARDDDGGLQPPPAAVLDDAGRGGDGDDDHGQVHGVRYGSDRWVARQAQDVAAFGFTG